MARIGYYSKGTVYVLIGLLAFMAALGIGGKAAGTLGMLRSLAEIPFGEGLLWLIGTGLIGYIFWNAIRVIKNPDRFGKSGKDAARRALYVLTGILYANVAYHAFRIIWQSRNEIYTQNPLTERFIQQTFGQWITGLIGLFIIGFGIYETYKGLSRKFMESLKDKEMDKQEKRIALYSGKLGLTARGIVFGLIGFFFIHTAVVAGLGQPIGLDRALATIARQPHGPWLLGIISIGLILYGISEMIKGQYKYMEIKK